MPTTAQASATQPLIETVNLTKWFPVKGGGMFRRSRKVVHAVEDLNLSIPAGETVALVGESGSGKSTLGRLVLGLLEPTRGAVRWKGREISGFASEEMRSLRGDMQIVFQDPLASLNPRKSIAQILTKPLQLHTDLSGSGLQDRLEELLVTVGLTPPELYRDRYPHELSGGQRQRVGIARAISIEPQFIVADEPVSGLDVSVQAQILNLLKRLQKEIGIAYLFITHDLAVVRSIAQRVVVMYLGELVEDGPVEEIFKQPLHPYTQALFSATPIPNPRRARARERIIPKGEIPSPTDPPAGCRFHTRCPVAVDECRTRKPELREVNGRRVACHLV